ncbi:MAG: hypothetical protein ACE5NM_01285 [Sedimentisphaerales bacterium]
MLASAPVAEAAPATGAGANCGFTAGSFQPNTNDPARKLQQIFTG